MTSGSARWVRPAVAAGDRASAEAGLDVMRAGGSATDAAVAAMLAACVAESVMTGLGGGGFATVWDAATRTATTIDFFVDTPGRGLHRAVEPMHEIRVTFGPQRLDYWVGAASVAVPGVPVGLFEVHRRWGRLPWPDVVQPAWRLAAAGVPMSAAKAGVLMDVQEGMVNSPEGRAAYAPNGVLLQGGDRLFHAGLADALAVLREDGPAAFASGGPVGAATLSVVAEHGGLLTAADLDEYRVHVRPARRVQFAGHLVHGRTDLLDLLGTLARLPADVGRISPGERALSWVRELLGADGPTGTTNVSAVDSRGDACAITTSLGLGAGVWVPDFGIHLNSMLGEGELMRGELATGDRVPSMMCPVVATEDGVLSLVAGAAGGSRIRSSLTQVLTGVLAQGLQPQAAVDRARLNPVRLPVVPDGRRRAVLVHAEPGLEDGMVDALAAWGAMVHQWERRAAYFGGVSAVGLHGGGADPRRDGAVRALDAPGP